MTAPAPAPRTRAPRKGERTAERILDAAEALFAEHGFAGTHLRDVAERVGLRIPSLYNHFASKEGLYAAVLERGLRPMLKQLEGVALERDAAREGERLVAQLMDRFAAHPSLARLIQHEVLNGGERLTSLLREWIRALLAQAQKLIEEGPVVRRWTAEEIPLLVLALYNIILGYFTIAPFYQELNGENLLSPHARERQTRLLEHLIRVLFLEEGPRPSKE